MYDVLVRVCGAPKGSGPEYQFACPFCLARRGSESDKPTLNVNVNRGKAKCFRCEYGTSSVKGLMFELFGRQLPADAQEAISGFTGEDEINLGVGVYAETVLRLSGVERAGSDKSDLLPIPMPKDCTDLTRRALRYARGRGINEDVVRMYGLMQAHQGRYRGHIIFPVKMFGDVVYWTTRYAGDPPDGRPKSDNPPKMVGYHGKSTCLLNFDNAMGQRKIRLTEGPFSCASYGRACVASLGRVLSEEQVRLLRVLKKNGTKELVIAYDHLAESYAVRAAQAVNGIFDKTTIQLFDSGDPNDEENRDRLDELEETGTVGAYSIQNQVRAIMGLTGRNVKV